MASSTKQTSHDLTAQPSSIETSQSFIDSKIPPEYTRKLIPMIGIPADEVDENFDEAAWFKKLYPNVIVLQTVGVPRGWVLVAGALLIFCPLLLMLDPKKPGKKVKKRWNKFDDDDPNCSINNDRAQYGLPPIDMWNIGIEYTYDGM